MQISSTEKLEEFVNEKVESGLYGDASEVIREALRLMREHDDLYSLKLERLRDALDKGESDLAAGRYQSFAEDDELTEFFASL